MFLPFESARAKCKRAACQEEAKTSALVEQNGEEVAVGDVHGLFVCISFSDTGDDSN